MQVSYKTNFLSVDNISQSYIVSHLHRAMNAGQLLDSAAGPVAMAAIPAMSATWFPPDQRTTATAIASRVQAFGGALPFVLGISVNQTIR